MPPPFDTSCPCLSPLSIVESAPLIPPTPRHPGHSHRPLWILISSFSSFKTGFWSSLPPSAHWNRTGVVFSGCWFLLTRSNSSMCVCGRLLISKQLEERQVEARGAKVIERQDERPVACNQWRVRAIEAT